MTVALLTAETFVTHYVGDTGDPFTVQFLDENFSARALTNVDMTLVTFRMMNTINRVASTGKGTWEALDRPKGIAWYRWHLDDVLEEGPFLCQATVPFPDGTVTFKPVAINFVARL